MEKPCFKCARRLPIEQFYRHPAMVDGRLGKCKQCTRLDVQANYSANREEKRRLERERYQRRKESMRRAAESRKHDRPDKYMAQRMLVAAVASGFLRALPCEVCGDKKTDGHHEDYSKPLDVRWLCRTHHQRRHAELKAMGVEL